MLRHRALVVGGGFSGLLCAEVLSRHFEEVVILDRKIPSPQAVHLHVLLARGRKALEEFFPGLDQELASHGCVEIDWANDTIWKGRFGEYPRYVSKTRTRSCSRVLLEKLIRERVFARSNVKTEYFYAHRVGKNVVFDKNGNTFQGDLVLDTTGRGSVFQNASKREEVKAFVGYASCIIRIENSNALTFKQIYVQLNPPDQNKGAVMIPIENGDHLLTLVGIGKEAPKTEHNHFLEFAQSLSHPRLNEILSRCEIVSPIHAYRRTAGLRVSTSNVKTKDFFSIGDAVTAFNPVYGQGMTVAALSALELDHCLKNKIPLSQKRLSRHSRFPWLLSVSEDFRVKGVKVQGMSLQKKIGIQLIGIMASLLLKRAVKSRRVHQFFLSVLHLEVNV